MTATYLTDHELKKAAFHLLACSTFGRFHRVSKRIAEGLTARTRLQMDATMLYDLLARCKQLWRCLRAKSQRDSEEAELSVLLALIAPTGDPGVADFLEEIGLADGPATVWVAALARRLLRENSLVDPLRSFANNVRFVTASHSSTHTLDLSHPSYSLSQDSGVDAVDADGTPLAA